MDYTPAAFTRINLKEAHCSDLDTLSGPALVRRLQLDRFQTQGEWLLLHTANLKLPLIIRLDKPMAFGSETITAIEYLKRVLERGDLIDVVARPASDHAIPIEFFWIHIEYVGERRSAGSFSQKEDGLFAMRAKAGEKGERIVARILRDQCGHSFDNQVFESPGYFEIRYDGTKKQRRPDLRCLACNLTFEVKKRNRDTRFRVSHSQGRPFFTENNRLGWHAFVFPDMKPRFLSNAAIASAIARGDFEPGSDQYDSWADVHGTGIGEMQPPQCSGHQVS